MPTTRRDFLHQSAFTAAGLMLAPHIAKALPQVGAPPGAEGLLFGAEDLPRMRETVTLPRFEAFWKSVLGADMTADSTFLSTELKLNNHVKDLLRARQILERTAFAYALTADTKQYDLAKLAIDRILEYKKWDYFLEGEEFTIGLQRAPETTIAMVTALDWLADRLPAATKLEMEKQIAEKGAPACYRTLYGMKYPDRVRGWSFDPESDYAYRFDLKRWPFILNSTNLKVIPIAGLAMAGCALTGKHPQAEQWVDLARQSARAFASMFGSDGSYDEGVGYWGYTVLHLTLAVEVMKRRLAIDERNIINYEGTIRYGMTMSMPTNDRPNDCVNFGDAGQMGDVSAAAWVARNFRSGLAQHVVNNVGTIANHFAVIWYDPSITATPPGKEFLDTRLVNDLVISRTGWEPGASVVAMRSGGPANHEHADRNSVIFSAYGERLFHDPYKAAYSHTDPHWVLRLTQAHTAVLIDGKGHQYHDGHEGTNPSWAEARVVRFDAQEERMIVSSDATEAYRLVLSDVGLVMRTLVFLKPDILLIIDRIRLTGSPRPVQLRYQVDDSDGKGSVVAGAFIFKINRPAASLQGQVTGSGDIAAKTGMLDAGADHGIHPYVEITSAAATEHLLVTTCTASPTGSDHGLLVVAKGESEWRVSGSHHGRVVRAVLGIGPDIPLVTV